MTTGIQLGIDWLSITVQPSPSVDVDVEQVRLATSLLLGCEPGDWTFMDQGMYGYSKTLVGPVGARIWWGAAGRQDIHVSLPGKACQVAGEQRMRSFWKYAMCHGGKPTRCDVNLDDYQRVIEPAELLEVIKGPDAVTHANKWLVQFGGDVRSPALTGETIYVGAPSSRQRLRIYDKGLESGGELDCVRWEIQARKEAAETLVQQLVAGDWPTVIRARLLAFIDFRDETSHSEVEKRVRLTWWENLIQGVKKGRVYLPKAIKTLEQVHNWVRDSIGPSLALVVAGYGGDLKVLTNFVDSGRTRWKPRHRAMLAQLV